MSNDQTTETRVMVDIPERRMLTIDAALLFRTFLDCGASRARPVGEPQTDASRSASSWEYPTGPPSRTGTATDGASSRTAGCEACVRFMPPNRSDPSPGGQEGRKDEEAPTAGRSLSGRGHTASVTPLGLAEALADQWVDPNPQTLL